ncbi:MAG: hypothetical protein Q8N77_02615 [Nanoarchaeota archaeon]|nr:hypothetical protein [Nanoarchaeota archaeon]
MGLENFFRNGKKWVAVPLLGLALAASPVACNNNEPRNRKVMLVNQTKVLEEHSWDYTMKVYFAGFRIGSCKLDFDFKKTEEAGIVKEIMSVSGRYSENYYGNISSEFSKGEDPFEKYTYFMFSDGEINQEKVLLYKDKVKISKDGLEKIVANEGYSDLQSVLKPLLTDDLELGRIYTSKVYFREKAYECKTVIDRTDDLGDYSYAYHAQLEIKNINSGNIKDVEFWVVEGKPCNKIVRCIFYYSNWTSLDIQLD